MIGLRFTCGKSVQLFLALAMLTSAGGFAGAQDTLATEPDGVHSTLCGDGRECELARQELGIACLAIEAPDNARAIGPSDDQGAAHTCAYRVIGTSCSAMTVPQYVSSDPKGEGQSAHREGIDVGVACVAVDEALNETLSERPCNAGRECNRAIRVVGNERVEIETPVRAQLDRSDDGGNCDLPASEGEGTCSLP